MSILYISKIKKNIFNNFCIYNMQNYKNIRKMLFKKKKNKNLASYKLNFINFEQYQHTYFPIFSVKQN